MWGRPSDAIGQFEGRQCMNRAAAAVSVLLVEDEVMISNLVADCLVESGFRVQEVATADEALRYIKSGANVDVLFTDINLPAA